MPKLKTNQYRVPNLNPNVTHVIINEDLEYAFPIEDLEYIKDFAERGIIKLAKELHRHEYEVLWAYIHLVRKGHQLPPLGVLYKGG